MKGDFLSGSVNTTEIINNRHSSVVAQFCRRAQEVVWNKVLVKTSKGSLGLVGQKVRMGDRICIMYGCGVPVLRRSSQPKSEETIDEDATEYLRELFKEFRRKSQDYRKRSEAFRQKRRDGKRRYKEWENKKRAQWRKDVEWRYIWDDLSRDKTYWEQMERTLTGLHDPVAEEEKHQLMERNDTWWDSWTRKRLEERKALQSIEQQELEMYHSLLQLKFPKSPWKVDKAWWGNWQLLKSKDLPRRRADRLTINKMLRFHH